MDISIVPIGKYKGQPLERLMADQSYSEWLLAQSWFIERYAELAQLLRMGRLSEPQDTPEHNAMVAGLIDQRDGMEWLIAGSYPNIAGHHLEEFFTARFEQELEPKGGDISVSFDGYWGLLVEVKPLIGDDYPSVIRQVKAAGRRGVVIARTVETTNLTLDQVRRQFELAGVRLILETEFFDGAKAWRNDRDAYLTSTRSEIETAIDRAKSELVEAEQSMGDASAASWDLQSRVTKLTSEVSGLNERLNRIRSVGA